MAWEDDDPEETAGAIARAFAANDEGRVPEDEPEVAGADSSEPPQSTNPQEQNNNDGSDYLSAPGDELPPEQQGPVAPEQQVDEQVYAAPVNELDSLAADPEAAGASAGTSVGTGGMRSAPIAPMAPQLADNSANYQQLEQEMSHFNPSDYKPSAGRRIVAGIGGALQAFGGNKNAGQAVRDYEGKPLARAQADEAQRENATRTAIAGTAAGNAQAQTNFGNQNTQFRNQESQINDEALQEQRAEHASDYAAQATSRRNAITQFTPNDPNNPYAGGTGVTADGRTQKNVPPPDNWLAKWEKSPQGTAAISKMSTAQRQQAADTAHLQGEQRAQFIATGKVSPTPRTSIHVPSAELQKYEDWRGQFSKDNGRGPNAAEIAGFGHTSSGAMSKPLGDKIESQKNTAFSQAKQAFMGNPDKAAGAEGYRSDLQDAQDAYEQRIENATGQPVPHVTVAVDKDGNVNWGGAQQSQQPAAQPQASPAAAPQQQQSQAFTYKGQSYTPGQQVMVDGKPAVVKGINPKTGKLIVGAQ